MHRKKKYVNKSFPLNSKTKRDITKISVVLKPLKSDYYVVKFWQKSEHFYFFGTERVKFDLTRYDEFSFLRCLDLTCPYVQNYVAFLLNKAETILKGRLKHHIPFWTQLGSLPWLLLFNMGLKYRF